MSKAPLSHILPLVIAVTLVVPGMVIRLGGPAPPALWDVVLFGLAFVGAALMLSWGTELARIDMPTGLAVSLLAFIAVLPEYAVSMWFAWRAGDDPSKAPLALANMTGANRLLIGAGWSLVVLMGALGARRARRRGGRPDTARASRYALRLGPRASVEVLVLGCVSLYTLTFIFRSSLTLVDAALLFGVFAFYVIRVRSAPKEEPELVGPPGLINRLPSRWRRAVMVALMAVAGAVILALARSFSEALLKTGHDIGVGEFLMVQWIAPLATETPELIPACVFAFRQNGHTGLGTLLSSKLNQWTLLVGGAPLVYAISIAGTSGLPMTMVERQEIFLTAAQSVFAVTFLADDMRLGSREALLILGLFVADLVASVLLGASLRSWARIGFSALYLLLTVGTLFRARRHLRELGRNGALVPMNRLGDAH